MKIVTTCILLLFVHTLSAQGAPPNSVGQSLTAGGLFYTDITGIPFQTQAYTDLLEGSPFFNEAWMQGLARLQNGTVIKSAQTRLNLLNNDVHYLAAGDAEFVATSNIKALLLTNVATGTATYFEKLPPEISRGASQWAEVLDSGSVVLYKLYRKKIFDQKPYNSANTERRILTTVSYLVKKGEGFAELKSVKELPAVLADKKELLESFLKTKDSKTNSADERIEAAVKYYNSLSKEQ